MEKDDNNHEIEEVKTFISALPDTEEELKILLNHMITFNNRDEGLKFNIVGNTYVKSLLNNFEKNIELNIKNSFKNKDKTEFNIVLDTDSFTSENIDFFINIIWKQVEDLNYPETNLEKDFEKVCNAIDMKLLDVGAFFYITYRETSLFDNVDLNQINKSKILKKNIDTQFSAFKYHSLDEFNQISLININGFCENLQKNEEFLNAFLNILFQDIEGKESLIKKAKNKDDFLSLILKDGFEEFLNEFENKLQGDFGLFDDVFNYVNKTAKELLILNDAVGEENKLLLDNPDFLLDKNEKVPKLYYKYTKILYKISSEYEQNKDENRDFRTKAINTLLSFSEIGYYEYDDILESIIELKKLFEEPSHFIETYIGMFIKTIEDFPVSDDNYGRSVNKILKEYRRILNNLKYINSEMENLEKQIINTLYE